MEEEQRKEGSLRERRGKKGLTHEGCYVLCEFGESKIILVLCCLGGCVESCCVSLGSRTFPEASPGLPGRSQHARPPSRSGVSLAFRGGRGRGRGGHRGPREETGCVLITTWTSEQILSLPVWASEKTTCGRCARQLGPQRGLSSCAHIWHTGGPGVLAPDRFGVRVGGRATAAGWPGPFSGGQLMGRVETSRAASVPSSVRTGHGRFRAELGHLPSLPPAAPEPTGSLAFQRGDILGVGDDVKKGGERGSRQHPSVGSGWEQ